MWRNAWEARHDDSNAWKEVVDEEAITTILDDHGTRHNEEKRRWSITIFSTPKKKLAEKTFEITWYLHRKHGGPDGHWLSGDDSDKKNQ